MEQEFRSMWGEVLMSVVWLISANHSQSLLLWLLFGQGCVMKARKMNPVVQQKPEPRLQVQTREPQCPNSQERHLCQVKAPAQPRKSKHINRMFVGASRTIHWINTRPTILMNISKNTLLISFNSYQPCIFVDIWCIFQGSSSDSSGDEPLFKAAKHPQVTKMPKVVLHRCDAEESWTTISPNKPSTGMMTHPNYYQCIKDKG